MNTLAILSRKGGASEAAHVAGLEIVAGSRLDTVDRSGDFGDVNIARLKFAPFGKQVD